MKQQPSRRSWPAISPPARLQGVVQTDGSVARTPPEDCLDPNGPIAWRLAASSHTLVLVWRESEGERGKRKPETGNRNKGRGKGKRKKGNKEKRKKRKKKKQRRKKDAEDGGGGWRGKKPAGRRISQTGALVSGLSCFGIVKSWLPGRWVSVCSRPPLPHSPTPPLSHSPSSPPPLFFVFLFLVVEIHIVIHKKNEMRMSPRGGVRDETRSVVSSSVLCCLQELMPSVRPSVCDEHRCSCGMSPRCVTTREAIPSSGKERVSKQR